MNTTEAPNTQCGMLWSMIQPNNRGLMMPPILKPVETMPKARPAAPAGAALRTSMSREGGDHAAEEAREPHGGVSARSAAARPAAMTSTSTALMPKQAAATWP